MVLMGGINTGHGVVLCANAPDLETGRPTTNVDKNDETDGRDRSRLQV